MKLVTVTQALREIGVQPVRVLKLCQQDHITGAQKVGTTWVIPKPLEVVTGTRGPNPTNIIGKKRESKGGAANNSLQSDCTSYVN